MKCSMLRTPSEDCQAGKGYLKRAVFVQAGQNPDKKRDPSNHFNFDMVYVIDAKAVSAKSL
jgi:hypothetical protein